MNEPTISFSRSATSLLDPRHYQGDELVLEQCLGYPG